MYFAQLNVLHTTTRNRDHRPSPWSMHDHHSRRLERGRAVVTWIHSKEDASLLSQCFRGAQLLWDDRCAPRGTFALWCDAKSVLKPDANIHTLSKSALWKCIWIHDSHQSVYFVSPQERLTKGQVYIKIEQVFINKCDVLPSVQKHSWVAKTLQAQQTSILVKSRTQGIPKGHFHKD